MFSARASAPESMSFATIEYYQNHTECSLKVILLPQHGFKNNILESAARPCSEYNATMEGKHHVFALKLSVHNTSLIMKNHTDLW